MRASCATWRTCSRVSGTPISLRGLDSPHPARYARRPPHFVGRRPPPPAITEDVPTTKRKRVKPPDETREILGKRGLMTKIRRGVREIEAGQGIPLAPIPGLGPGTAARR